MNSITNLNLDTYTIIALCHEDITTIDQLLTMTRIDLLKIRRIGEKRADEIIMAIEQYKKSGK